MTITKKSVTDLFVNIFFCSSITFSSFHNSELSVSVYHAFSPQKSMAKNKNVPGGLVRMFFQRFQSEFLRTEYPPA